MTRLIVDLETLRARAASAMLRRGWRCMCPAVSFMSGVCPHGTEGLKSIPAHANKKSEFDADERAASLRFDFAYPLRARVDAYIELVRIDLNGLHACTGACGSLPVGRCEHHEVEHRLGRTVHARHPDDLAIAYALRLEAEFRDDEGVDHLALIREALEAGAIDAEAAVQQLALESANRDREIEAAAFEIMTVRNGTSDIGSTRERRWRDDLTPSELCDRKRLQDARFNGGLTTEDSARYQELTMPQPIEPVDWTRIQPGLCEEAEARVKLRRLRTAGKRLERRVSSNDRSRQPSYVRRPLSTQLGEIATSEDPRVLVRGVRDLRRNAKRLGFHSPGHDRRSKRGRG